MKLDIAYDILISETLTSGFVQEDFPEIISQLKRDDAHIIPQAFDFKILERDRSKKSLRTQTLSLESQNLPTHSTLTLHPDTHMLEIYSQVTLVDGISIES